MERRKTTYRVALTIFLVIAATVSASAQQSFIEEIAGKTKDSTLDLTTAQLCGHAPAFTGSGYEIINDRRNTSPLNEAAAKYIYYKFKEYGCDARFTDTTLHPSMGKYETIYSVKPGQDPKKVVILAAGFDSNSSGTDSISPGANMSASSCAIVLEAARIMKNYDTKRTMIFILFDDMNNSGYGLQQLYDSLSKQGYEATTAIFLDNLGYKGDDGFLQLYSRDTTKIASIQKAFRDVMNTLNPGEPDLPTKNYFTPFAGLPGFNNAEEVAFARNYESGQPYVSSTEDTFENLELPFFHNNARIAIASFALLAEPVDVGVLDPASAGLAATNPCLETLKLRSSRTIGALRIFDAFGKEVYSGFEAGTESLINIAAFSRGVYFVQAGGETVKFV